MAEMPPGTDKMLTVSENESVAQVLTDLQEKHLIKSKYSFYARLQLEEKINKNFSRGVSAELIHDLWGDYSGTLPGKLEKIACHKSLRQVALGFCCRRNPI